MKPSQHNASQPPRLSWILDFGIAHTKFHLIKELKE
jgi:hypothetical protein